MLDITLILAGAGVFTALGSTAIGVLRRKKVNERQTLNGLNVGVAIMDPQGLQLNHLESMILHSITHYGAVGQFIDHENIREILLRGKPLSAGTVIGADVVVAGTVTEGKTSQGFKQVQTVDFVKWACVHYAEYCTDSYFSEKRYNESHILKNSSYVYEDYSKQTRKSPFVDVEVFENSINIDFRVISNQRFIISANTLVVSYHNDNDREAALDRLVKKIVKQLLDHCSAKNKFAV